MNNFESVLNLEKLAFEEIRFERDTSANLSNLEYEMNFSRSIGTSDDGKHFCVKLTGNLRSKKPELLSIKITLTGYFYCECDDEALKESLIKYNTIAILFPYIRSQVSLVTAQPDLTLIVIPPVNVIAMFESVDNPSQPEESKL